MAASDEIGTRVDRRLAELYERHRQAELPADARCYVSGQGYRAVKTSGGSDDAFAIALAGLDGSLASVGDDDVAFALQSVSVDERVLELELADADRNRATAYLMRTHGMIAGDVGDTLHVYLSQCSIKVTCRQLAIMAATLANGGVNPVTGRVCLPRARVRDVLSVMYTCGMYDFAGEWAYEVGVPAKSGVSGAILCVIPGKLGIAVFSPGLDEYGNSIRGVRVCQEISERLGLHVFATEDEDELLGDPASG